MQAFVLGLWLATNLPLGPRATYVAGLDACEVQFLRTKTPLVWFGNDAVVLPTSEFRAGSMLVWAERACHPDVWPTKGVVLWLPLIIVDLALFLTTYLMWIGLAETVLGAFSSFFVVQIAVPVLKGYYFRGENLDFFPQELSALAGMAAAAAFASALYREVSAYKRAEEEERNEPEDEDDLREPLMEKV